MKDIHGPKELYTILHDNAPCNLKEKTQKGHVCIKHKVVGTVMPLQTRTVK